MQQNTTLEQLEQSVIQWAEERSIFSKATAYKQAQKTLEECGELLYAVGKQEAIKNDPWSGQAIEQEVKGEIKDAIGDICVTIIIGAKMQGLTLQECLQSAYDEIKNRQGKMVNGQFVKEN